MRVLIAGGGVAGGAAACLLGPDCTLVERDAAPQHKICGEFLSVEAAHYLRRLGIDLPALGAAPVAVVRLVHGATVVETRLPFPAFGLSRRVLDAALLARAASSGAEVIRGHAIRMEGGVPEIAGGRRFERHTVFLATGKHDLHGLRRPPPSGKEDRIGVKMHLRLDPAQAAELANGVEVILFDGGYGGLQPIDGGAANLCVLMRRAAFVAAGTSWVGVQAMLQERSAHLRRRLEGAVSLLPRPSTISRVPYGFVHRPGPDDPVFRLGDQAAVIPSFSGDGMSIALHSAVTAVSARDDGAAQFHRRLAHDVRAQMLRARALDRLIGTAPGILAGAARAWPGAIRWAARLTRLPGSNDLEAW